MDHLEFRWQLRRELVALGVAALILAGCAGTEPASNDASPAAGATASAEPTAGPPASADAGPADEAPTAAPTAVPGPTPTPPPPLRSLDAQVVATGLRQPVLVTSAPGTSALFVLEREGLIRTVQDGVVAEEPFLDLRDQINSSSIEQGLLGLAFHPDFESNGRFYAYWTQQSGDSRLAQFTASSDLAADPSSMKVILDVAQPGERHNAGTIAFGPDGLLFLGLGDGGSGGETAQDTSNLLGSVLRLDVDSGDPYAIPPGNPFGDEIWVYGLRNPWRFSIDPVDRLVYIGDVGQDKFEEINVVSLDDGGGTNFGWLPMEGDQCFAFNCDRDGLTLPTVQYTHEDGCSVTGGWVYRGSAIPELFGQYFYADWCSGLVRSFRMESGEVRDETDWTTDLGELGQVTSFGLDNDAELYAVNWEGELLKIVPVR